MRPKLYIIFSTKKGSVLLSVCCLLLCNLVNAQVQEIFSQPRQNRIFYMKRAYDEIKDTAVLKRFADSLATESTKQNEIREKWYAELLYLNVYSFLNERTIKQPTALLQKEDHFKKSPSPDIEATFYFLTGDACNRLQDFEKAFHYFFLADNKLQEAGYQHVPLMPRIVTGLADFYAQFEDYTSAVKFSRLALQYNNPLLYSSDIYTLNNLGFYLLKIKNYDEAEQSFKKVIELAQAQHIIAYIGIGSGNLGNILRIKGLYKQAMPYLYKDVSLNEVIVPENAATSCLYLADCLLNCDSTSKAITFIRKAKELAARSYYQKSFYPMYYHTNALYYKSTGNYALAAAMQDSLLNLNDSLKRLFDNKILLATTLKEKETAFLANENMLKLNVKNTVLLRNLVIGGLLLLFGAIYFALWQRSKREKALAQKKELEANISIQMANQKMEQFVIQIKEKNDIIDSFREQLNEVSKTNNMEPADEYKLLQRVILTEDDWSNFKQLFNQAQPGFLTRLGIDYPQLSPAEIRLLVLQQLPISTKHQAAMLGISAASLRTAKYRLRKKYPQLLADDEGKED